ncbi:hypothetical protein [Conexibacter sp. CPCC 206217]|uniref:hypothetical protein n=1 Tax=Conexibacter sp. CPCC 206217 TaxID=3064574 RepID=UPI002728879B|nr:hypothetical protein [Conexibacter sp. CPCC 206217]MDO8213759.1 hypothetical protein [Conexibacter sp. CPCC 206217]
MADRILCLTWRQVARGREAYSLEVFNDAVGYYAGLQETGRIERFDAVLTPAAEIDGMMLLHGTHAQLDAVVQDDRFQQILAEAALVVDDLRVVEGYGTSGIPEAIGRFQEAIAHLPQTAAA